jgi:HEPN domain-containing protein
MGQFIPNYKQRSSEVIEYAELDLEDGNYISAFLKSCGAIRLAGEALLISKGYYAPSTRHMINNILHLHAIQEKYDKYIANPDGEAIERGTQRLPWLKVKSFYSRQKAFNLGARIWRGKP